MLFRWRKVWKVFTQDRKCEDAMPAQAPSRTGTGRSTTKKTKEMETGAVRKDARMGGSKASASEELLQVGSGCVKGK